MCSFKESCTLGQDMVKAGGCDPGSQEKINGVTWPAPSSMAFPKDRKDPPMEGAPEPVFSAGVW